MASSKWSKPFINTLRSASSYYNSLRAGTSSNSAYQHIHNPAHQSGQHVPLYPTTSEYPQQPTSYAKPPSASLKRHQQTLLKLKKWVKIVTTASTIISAMLTIFMEASMIYMVIKWLQTRNKPASDGSRGSPWPRDTVVWPTYMLLSASGITLVLCIGILLAECCRNKKKKKMFGVAYDVTHVLSWLLVSILYRVFKTEKDLWGWSCSTKAAEIQGVFEGVVDFDGLCSLQSTDWSTSIAETAIKVVFSGLAWYLKRKGSLVRTYIVAEVGELAETFVGAF